MSSAREDRYIIFEPTRHGIRAGYAGTSDPRCVMHPVDYTSDCIDASITAAMAAAYRTIGAAEQPALLLLPNGMPRSLVSKYVKAVFDATATSQAAVVWRAAAAVLATNSMNGLFVDCEGPPGAAVVVPVIDGSPIRHAATTSMEGPSAAGLREILNIALARAGPAIAARVIPGIVVVADDVAAKETEVAVAFGSELAEGALPTEGGEQEVNGDAAVSSTEDIGGAAAASEISGGAIPLTDISASAARFRRIPTFLEYYASRPELTAYLGACLLAKQVFADSRSYLARSEFDAHGPRALFSRIAGHN